MDNLCVYFKEKIVKYEKEDKRYHILQLRSGEEEKYFLNKETLEKLNKILAKRKEESVESLQTQISELKTTMKIQLRQQNTQLEELKSMIQELVVKSSQVWNTFI